MTVLIDVAYMEFAGDATRGWVDAVPALDEERTVLVAWTASKSMAQYGARIGAIVALHEDDDERAQMDNALGYTARATWSNCHHLGQRAVTTLLTDPELSARVTAERARSRIYCGHASTYSTRSREPGYSDTSLRLGFFVTMFTPDQDETAAAMRELGVYTVPIPGAVRVAICSTPAETIPRLVVALEKGLAAVT